MSLLNKLNQELKKRPLNSSRIISLTRVFVDEGHIATAEQYLMQAAQIMPSPLIMSELAYVYSITDRNQLACDILERVISESNAPASAYLNYANVLSRQGEYEHALQQVRIACEKDSSLFTSSIVLSSVIKENMGDVEQAFDDIYNLIKTGKFNLDVLWAFCNIVSQHKKFSSFTDEAILHIEDHIENGLIPPDALSSYYFKLSQLYNVQGKYAAAIKNVGIAHEVKKYNYDEQRQKYYFEKVKDVWGNKEDDASIGKSVLGKRTFIFIVGMPRSGSTLVEQVLSVSADCQSLGESHLFSSTINEVFQGTNDPAIIGGRILDDQEVKKIRSLFVQKVFQKNSPKPLVLDKTLINTFHVGQILQCFPQAKIIWTRRDPRDTCVSCYMQDFTGALSYRHKLTTLARYHNWTEDLMNFWQKKFPESVLQVKYEDMVLSPEYCISEMVGKCGLIYSDEYLDFHKVDRAVATASYNQVKRPMYRTSLKRWTNYKEYIGPLLDELEVPADYQD